MADGCIADVREKQERAGCAKFLPLKQQWCPRSEQKKSGHRPIASRGSLNTRPFTWAGVRNLIVICDKTNKRLRGNAERRSATHYFPPGKCLPLIQKPVFRSGNKFLRFARVIA